MNSSDESLHMSTDVLDALFVHALRGSVAQAAPPNDAWNHIEQAVQRFPVPGDFDVSHLPQASYMPLTETRPHL